MKHHVLLAIQTKLKQPKLYYSPVAMDSATKSKQACGSSSYIQIYPAGFSLCYVIFIDLQHMQNLESSNVDTLKRRSGSRLGRDERDIPTFDTVSLHSNLGSPRRNYLSIITTDINVLNFGSVASKRLLKIRHWWLKNRERKVGFRFVERKFLAAINLTGSAEGALVPVLLRITYWTKSGLPVSPLGLFPALV